MRYAKKLPYFTIGNVAGIESDRNYLKTLFSRYAKSGKLIRIKRGIYATKEYVDTMQKNGAYVSYVEFLSAIMYQPSYMSLDYILYQRNILTDIPKNFTCVTKRKTARFSNVFGNFFYHAIKEDLFCGYENAEENTFIIPRATAAKALFDYLYFRKNHIVNREAFSELRLNTKNLSKKDIDEFKKYIRMEGSKKMKDIAHYFL